MEPILAASRRLLLFIRLSLKKVCVLQPVHRTPGRLFECHSQLVSCPSLTLECDAISFFKVNRTSRVCDILSVVEMSGRRDRRSKLFPQAIGTGHRSVQKPDEVQGSQSVVGHSAA